MSIHRYNSPVEKTAYILSAIFHPVTFLVVSMLILGYYIEGSLVLALRDIGIFILGILPGWCYHYYELQKRKTLDYTEVRHYHTVILVSLLCGFSLIIAAYAALGTPLLFIQLLVIKLVVIFGCVVINRFWKISFHAAIPMTCSAILIPTSLVYVAIIACFGLIAGFSRLPLKLHTVQQILAGWIYGFVTTSILVLALAQ